MMLRNCSCYAINRHLNLFYYTGSHAAHLSFLLTDVECVVAAAVSAAAGVSVERGIVAHYLPKQ